MSIRDDEKVLNPKVLKSVELKHHCICLWMISIIRSKDNQTIVRKSIVINIDWLIDCKLFLLAHWLSQGLLVPYSKVIKTIGNNFNS